MGSKIIRLELVAAAEPNYFGWKAPNFAHFAEVGILRHEGESPFARIIPYLSVGGLIQPNAENVDRAWVEVGKMVDKSGRKVLVEEELHPCTTNCWRSRSAA
jgi:hypothetical protein